jgi:ATP-dependent helicase HepA
LVDFVERFTRWDDRGTAFITWRTAPEWNGEICINFRLCFVIEPNIQIVDLLHPSSADLANARRAQRYFPLRTHTVHVDVNADKVNDEMLLGILRRPYRNKDRYGSDALDINLSSRPHILSELIDAATFSSICLSVRDAVSSRLLADETIAKAIRLGVRVAQADVERRRNRLMLRNSLGDGMAQADIEAIEKLLPAIQHPAIRLDAMGCFIVANTPPEQMVDA